MTRHFNIHTYNNLKRYNFSFQPTVEFLKIYDKVRFYSVDLWPELVGRKNCYIFPRFKFIDLSQRPDYHCGSFDWMVTMAIDCLEGAPDREIVVHGVSLLIEAGEPISARACLEYWLGVAEGRGIKVTCMPDCDLFAFYHLVKSNMVYGYDDTPIYEDRTRLMAAGDTPYKLPDPVV